MTVETPLGSVLARLTDAAGALGGRRRFEYNAHDQLTKITEPQNGVSLSLRRPTERRGGF